MLLSPPAQGFSLLAWVLPLGGLAVGVVVALAVLRSWVGPRPEPDEAMDPEMLAAVRQDMKVRGL